MSEVAAPTEEKSTCRFDKAAAEFLAREIFKGLFQREPIDGELISTAAAIQSTGQLAPLLESYLDSNEFRKKTFDAAAPDIVRAAYAGILRREADPRGLQIHTDWLRRDRDIAALLGKVIGCDEFDLLLTAKMPHELRFKFLAPLWSFKPKTVDIQATPEQFKLIFERIHTQWTNLGDTEPHWSVATHDKFKTKNFAQHEEEFYQSGVTQVGVLEGITRRAGLELNPAATVLELGCGTGRVTHALASAFARVIAVDISPGNMRLCQEKLRAMGKTNVEYVLLQSPEEIQNLAPFDLFFTTIVLQHNPPPVIYYFLDHILGKLRKPGMAYFQVPTHRPDYTFDIAQYLASPPHPGMEMHCLPMPAVFSLLAKHGLRPVEVLMDTATGTPGSHTFFVVKE
jgi:SAM-dependent methyltransferase